MVTKQRSEINLDELGESVSTYFPWGCRNEIFAVYGNAGEFVQTREGWIYM